jgi:uncharacterized membrane protein
MAGNTGRMVEIHYVAGLLALLAGFVALFAPKGGYLHRRSGRVFVASMVLMLGLAAVMALFVVDEHANGVGALLVIYLVVTSLLTVTRRVEDVRRLTAGLAAAGFALGAWALALAVVGAPGAQGDSPQGGLLAAAIGIGGSMGDLRMLRKGAIAGAQRLVRHLWRMTVALFVATGSFFLGQAKVLPVPLQNYALLSVPVLVVLAMLVYWLARVAKQKSRAIRVARGSVP